MALGKPCSPLQAMIACWLQLAATQWHLSIPSHRIAHACCSSRLGGMKFSLVGGPQSSCWHTLSWLTPSQHTGLHPLHICTSSSPVQRQPPPESRKVGFSVTVSIGGQHPPPGTGQASHATVEPYGFQNPKAGAPKSTDLQGPGLLLCACSQLQEKETASACAPHHGQCAPGEAPRTHPTSPP